MGRLFWCVLNVIKICGSSLAFPLKEPFCVLCTHMLWSGDLGESLPLWPFKSLNVTKVLWISLTVRFILYFLSYFLISGGEQVLHSIGLKAWINLVIVNLGIQFAYKWQGLQPTLLFSPCLPPLPPHPHSPWGQTLICLVLEVISPSGICLRGCSVFPALARHWVWQSRARLECSAPSF